MVVVSFQPVVSHLFVATGLKGECDQSIHLLPFVVLR